MQIRTRTGQASPIPSTSDLRHDETRSSKENFRRTIVLVSPSSHNSLSTSKDGQSGEIYASSIDLGRYKRLSSMTLVKIVLQVVERHQGAKSALSEKKSLHRVSIEGRFTELYGALWN